MQKGHRLESQNKARGGWDVYPGEQMPGGSGSKEDSWTLASNSSRMAGPPITHCYNMGPRS